MIKHEGNLLRCGNSRILVLGRKWEVRSERSYCITYYILSVYVRVREFVVANGRGVSEYDLDGWMARKKPNIFFSF